MEGSAGRRCAALLNAKEAAYRGVRGEAFPLGLVPTSGNDMAACTLPV